MRSSRIFSIVILLAAACIAYWMYNRYRVAPDIQEKNVRFLKDGQTVALNELLGEDLAVVFYAHWCGPCKMELQDLKKLYGEFQEKGLRLIALTDDNPEMFEKLRNHYQIPFEMYRLEGTLHDIGIYTIPTAYVFDQDGKLVFEQVDKWDWTERSFLTQLFSDLD